MRKPPPSSTIFGRHRNSDRRPTGGAIQLQAPSFMERFLVVSPMMLTADQREAQSSPPPSWTSPPPTRPASIRTLAERFAPVPVGVLNSVTGAAISVSNWASPLGDARSAVTPQSPELGDWLSNLISISLCGCLLRWDSHLAVPQRLVHLPPAPTPAPTYPPPRRPRP